MTEGFFLYAAVMMLVTYLIRAVPFVLFQRKVKSRFFRSFLHYIPYTVLASMTFPAILTVTSSFVASAVGMLVGIWLAYRGKGLVTVSLVSCGVAFLILLLPFV